MQKRPMSTPPITETKTAANVEESVPFFGVTNMEASLRFYMDGLGFEMPLKWVVDGSVRWCRLQHGGAAIMLQEFRNDRVPAGKLGLGVSVSFTCKDALAIYHQAKARGIATKTPFVGNGLWVTALVDPDGYRIDFASPTDAPEESEYVET
jgi:lactoylglutathione lyase